MKMKMKSLTDLESQEEGFLKRSFRKLYSH